MARFVMIEGDVINLDQIVRFNIVGEADRARLKIYFPGNDHIDYSGQRAKEIHAKLVCVMSPERWEISAEPPKKPQARDARVLHGPG